MNTKIYWIYFSVQIFAEREDEDKSDGADGCEADEKRRLGRIRVQKYNNF